MKFKKLSALFLAGAMCLSIAACSGGGETTPLGQAGGREKTGSWEVVVPVFSEWDYSPVERGGENRVTHNTLRCGEIVTLYRNRKGKWSLTRYSRRSLARYYLKHLAGWTAAWSTILLVLTLGGSGL